MKLVLDDTVSSELKEYLLMQDGITKVELNNKSFLVTLNIEYNKNITPSIIMKYIELFQKNTYSTLYEFDKGISGNYKVLNYTIDDICCDYCYKGLLMDLFENEKIKSVKSNYDYNKATFDVDFIIEYDENYDEQKTIDFINERFN